MLTDKIKHQLEFGGYQKLQTDKMPCQIWIRRGAECCVVCLFEDNSGFKGQAVILDEIVNSIQISLERQINTPCRMLVLLISDDIGRDKELTKGKYAVWLMDFSGRRIVFDNQPGNFGDLENLLEKKIYPWSRILRAMQSYVPWVTISLVVINVIVQIIVAFQESRNGYSSLLYQMVLQIGSFKENPEYYRLLSSAFLHFGWDHLFNNMLVLLFLGKMAEQAAGRLQFGICYLVCAIGANIASAIWYIFQGELTVFTAGASGAVFGIVGMILVLIIAKRGRLGQLSMRQIVMMMFFTFYHGMAEGGVNNCAHIAGAVLGILCGVIIVAAASKQKNAIAK